MPKSLLRISLFSVLLAFFLGGVHAAENGKEGDAGKDETSSDAKAKGKESDKADKEEIASAEKERTAVTHHELLIGGRSVRYTATAGTVLLRDDKDKPAASMFYVAYTADGEKASSRPITFLYNGGPGSSSVWLHMGSVGPVRVETSSPQATPPAPYRVVANSDSLIDKSDLVFIDAIGAGFSKPIGKAEGKDFWGVDQDVKSFGQAITRYVSVNKRWNSPKFLLGESYGTTRSAALVAHLQSKGMEFNGVVLVSSVLNYGARSPGLDHSYANDLPTFAATAWFHDRIANKPANLDNFLNEVRAYARGEYSQALAKGQDMSAAEADAVAQKLHQYTGLSVAYLKEANLRVGAARFRKELLRDERRTLGRYDGRFEGIDLDAAGENPDYDASESAIKGAFTAAFNDYLSDQLNYRNDAEYKTTGTDIIQKWDWKHEQPGARFPQRQPYVAGDLAEAMRKNPRLQVFSANGYFDLATPFFATEFDLGHMQLDASLRKNLSFGYYPSGHMIYLNLDALKMLKVDLAKFYDSATRKP